MTPIRIALAGLGKIARDQHLPAIVANGAFQLMATVDPMVQGLPDVPHFPDLPALLAEGLALDAVALCTPPRYRYGMATVALAHGLHVLLEKPPAETFVEAESLRAAAAAGGTTLFAAWHSRFAPGVEPARAWLAQREIKRVVTTWHEDVRVWHPGQHWILEKGGFGVFDPGINALSILTRILPRLFRLSAAKLFSPANWQTPITANLTFTDSAHTEILLDLDWTKAGAPRWDIEIETDRGPLRLEQGGARLSLPQGEGRDAARNHAALSGEYPALYEHFAWLVAARESDADMTPLRHVADAFEIAEQHRIAAFDL